MNTNELKQSMCCIRRQKLPLCYLIKLMVLEMGEATVKEKYLVNKLGWEREYHLENEACDNVNRIVLLNSQKLVMAHS